MKISCGWMYVIGRYGFPPKLENIHKGIKEMSNLGFEFIEMEGVKRDNLIEVINNKANLLKLCNDLGLKLANFAILLPEIFSMDAPLKKEALELFKKGVETAKYLNSDFVWIDSFVPPVEVKSGKTFAQNMEFGVQIKVKIPSGFVWNNFWNNFVDSVKKCNQIAKNYEIPLVIEPRVGEVISNSDALLRLIELVGSKNFGVILDTAHLHAGKEILPLSIEKLGPHIKYVHIADNDGSNDRHLIPGEGTIDWEEVFISLKRWGYDGYYAVDLEKFPDSGQKFLECKQFLEYYGNKLSI